MLCGPLVLAELTRPESLRLLDQVSIGRIVYTMRALPAIVPVCHLVDNGMVVVRTHIGAECAGSVVAYQADELVAVNGGAGGWTVTVTGVARRVLDPDELAGYEQRLRPLVAAEGVETIRIYPEIVTGYRLSSTTTV
ncbi:MAG: pyridoxamine 5'-phosphate oxidase family protein [Actinophytocola sp.]|uniref:pyridoxamine 5'-phosphate oxidase family protein n=1 Tax=Actinophytocola sp. TaxID=1872138 RepID=UPI003D6C4153